MPNSVDFETVYRPGILEAVSYKNGKEISRALIQTSGAPAQIKLAPEKTQLKANGQDVLYVGAEISIPVKES